MAPDNIFETIGELTYMRKAYLDTELVELRGGNLPNPRQRVEKIIATHPNTGKTSSVGGNSSVFVKESGRLKERQVWGVTAHYLHAPDRDMPDIAIYPYGIDGVTEKKSPIFQTPHTSTMKAIVLVYPDYSNPNWLERPIEPLFNIDEDGIVLTQLHDLPTPSELQLLQDILTQFEAAI